MSRRGRDEPWLPVEPLDHPPTGWGGGGTPTGGSGTGQPIPAPGGPRATQWRWYVGGAVLVALLVTLALIDRGARRTTPDRATPTTAAATTTIPTAETEPQVTQRAVPPAADTTGTLYVLAEDETLTEIDLATGQTREAPLSFPVETWFANQAVPLRTTVLVMTRRQVWAVDRATLLDQRRVGSDAWVAAAPDGSWAALVPFNGAGGGVVLLDGNGEQTATVTLPPGVEVVGVTDDVLVVNAAGTIRLLGRDGRPVATPADLAGQPFAVGPGAVARIVCTDARTCELRSGPLAQPDAQRTDVPALGGRWVFGPAGIISSDDRLLAFSGVDRQGTSVARVLDLANGRLIDGPLPFGRSGAIPALAFTPDTAVVQNTPSGVAIWRPAPDGAAAMVATVDFEAEVLAVGTTIEPPPELPTPAGPPPSFA